jgi:hypothetical protein
VRRFGRKYSNPQVTGERRLRRRRERRTEEGAGTDPKFSPTLILREGLEWKVATGEAMGVGLLFLYRRRRTDVEVTAALSPRANLVNLVVSGLIIFVFGASIYI